VEFDPPPGRHFGSVPLVEVDPPFKRDAASSSLAGPTIFMTLNRLVLIINASYEPIDICSARRALKLVFKGAATVEEVSAYTVRTSKIAIPIPSVVRLQRYRRIPRRTRAVSRRGIILRDGGACQYCQTKLLPRDLTLDHVMPKSRGGSSTWENLVACCFDCNNRKGNRTPREAGMPLARLPRQIGIHAKHRLMIGDEKLWERYLFC
jgi:5-methylcytosine-specific restriction endonuclease McrA